MPRKGKIEQYMALLLIWVLLTWQSCTEPPPPTLVHRDRMLIDSLFREYVQKRKPQLDSICQALWETRVRQARDSIVRARVEEIRRRKQQIEARLRAQGSWPENGEQ